MYFEWKLDENYRAAYGLLIKLQDVPHCDVIDAIDAILWYHA